MDRDSGLTGEPWLSIVTGDDGVFVEGTEVEGPGTVDHRYQAALQGIAHDVAGPLGRAVGVTVTAADGGSRHVAVHPDGTVEDLDELITAAAAPLPAAGQAAVPAGAVAAADAAVRPAVAGARTDWPGLGSRRPLVAGAAVALVALLSGVVVVSNVWGDSAEPPATSDTARFAADPSDGAAPDVAPDAAPASPPAQVLRTVAARVVPRSPCAVGVVVDTSPPRARVKIVFRSPDGTKAVREVRAAQGTVRELFELLPPGRTEWRIRMKGTETLRGVVKVMPPPA